MECSSSSSYPRIPEIRNPQPLNPPTVKPLSLQTLNRNPVIASTHTLHPSGPQSQESETFYILFPPSLNPQTLNLKRHSLWAFRRKAISIADGKKTRKKQPIPDGRLKDLLSLHPEFPLGFPGSSLPTS